MLRVRQLLCAVLPPLFLVALLGLVVPLLCAVLLLWMLRLWMLLLWVVLLWAVLLWNDLWVSYLAQRARLSTYRCCWMLLTWCRASYLAQRAHFSWFAMLKTERWRRTSANVHPRQ